MSFMSVVLKQSYDVSGVNSETDYLQSDFVVFLNNQVLEFNKMFKFFLVCKTFSPFIHNLSSQG
jgi:hypothetical protein